MRNRPSESVVDELPFRFGDPQAFVDSIPSYTDAAPSSPLLDDDRLGELVEAMDRLPLREALDVALADYPDRDRFLRRVFRHGSESWRILVADALEGSCLDLTAGFGTRALLLAEVDGVEEVYAADECPDALRFLSARTDYDPPAPVMPVHGGVHSLPDPAETFDTVVVDTSSVEDWSDLDDTIGAAARMVGHDGSLVATLDGATRLSGLTDALGLETSGATSAGPPDRDLSTAVRATPSRYRSLFESHGFDDVELYALVPDYRDPKYGFRLSDDVFDALVRLQRPVGDRFTRIARRLVDVGAFASLLRHSLPSYVAVCRRQTAPDSSGPGPALARARDEERLLVRGRARSIALDHADGELRRVRKFPHRRTHETFVTNEYDVLAALGLQDQEAAADDSGRSTAAPDRIRRTVPVGSLQSSQFGPVYVEPPASGVKLDEFVSRDPDDFRRALSIGLDWIATFQRTYGGDPTTVTAQEIRDDLSVPHLDLEPPSVPSSLTLFPTPIHGDYQTGNLYVDPGDGDQDAEICRVIDWEYAALSDNPVTDPAFIAIWVAGLAFDDLHDGLREAFVDDTVHSRIVRRQIRAYCDAVGLDPLAFSTYLPYVWIRRLQICEDLGATMHYTERGENRAETVEFIWARADEIADTLTS